MNATGELIHLPVLSPASNRMAGLKVQNVGKFSREHTWRYRIYRIASQQPGNDFVYGSDGCKRMQLLQGKHVDLYA